MSELSNLIVYEMNRKEDSKFEPIRGAILQKEVYLHGIEEDEYDLKRKEDLISKVEYEVLDFAWASFK